MFDVCTTGDTAHIDTIFKFLPKHASTWVHRYSSLLQWSLPLSQRCHVAMVLCILCTKCTLHSNYRLTRVIFQHTKRLLPRVSHFSHHISSHRLTAEMWTTMENNLLGKKNLSCSFYLYMFRKYMYYGFPITNFCNPGVNYETPCIFPQINAVKYNAVVEWVTLCAFNLLAPELFFFLILTHLYKKCK